MGVKVQGMEALLSKFSQLEKKAQKDLGSKALDRAGDIVKDSIISKAPEDTGALKSSIEKSKATGSGTNRKVEVGNMNATGDVKRYLYYQNYGSRHIVGKKFMERGFNDSVKEASDVIKQTLIEELK